MYTWVSYFTHKSTDFVHIWITSALCILFYRQLKVFGSRSMLIAKHFKAPHYWPFVRGIHRWSERMYSFDTFSVNRPSLSEANMGWGVKSVGHFCEARRASHCHSPQTTFSSNSACYVLSTQKSAMHVVVYADRLTTQHSIVDIAHWSWSYWQFWYPRWHVECFWPALAAHWISSASHTSVLPQHPRRKIVPYRVGWNHHTSDYHG